MAFIMENKAMAGCVSIDRAVLRLQEDVMLTIKELLQPN